MSQTERVFVKDSRWRRQLVAYYSSVGFLLLFLFAPALAQPARGPAIAELIEKLGAATRNQQEIERNSVVEQLRELGTNALPVILEEMKTAEVPLRINLVHVVRGIGGDESTQALLQIALNDPDSEVSRLATSSIDNRVIRRRLTAEEWATLKQRIKTGSSGEAQTWAYILAHSSLIHDPQIVESIIERFMEDVQNPSLDASRPHLGSYITGKAKALNSYLRAFFFMDSALAIPALKRRMTTAADPKALKWLTIALGMAGDENQEQDLQKIVEDVEEDVSVRAEALRAYTRATKARAIPLLESLLKDKTPGPDPLRPPLALVARGELYWLRNPEKRREFLGKYLEVVKR